MSKLYDCLLMELAEIHDAEKQLTKALPGMAQTARHEELQTAFLLHRDETLEHVRRIEKVFQILGEKIPGQKCKAMLCLIAECQRCIDDGLGDASLICAAQKIEHYEIATYGCLRSWAQFLEMTEAANLMEETLDEEGDADGHLTSLAVQIINLEAGEPEHTAKRDGSPDE